MKNIFNWISKHFAVIQFLGVYILFPIVTLITEFADNRYTLPAWLIAFLLFAPLSLYILIQYLVSLQKRKFKFGDHVVFKGSNGFIQYYVYGYSFFQKGIVIINDQEGKQITTHQDSLDYFDPLVYARIV